jgi:hypothetical protein
MFKEQDLTTHFLLVMIITSIRMMGIATISDLEMHQMDVQIIASPKWGIRKGDFHGTTNLEGTKSL